MDLTVSSLVNPNFTFPEHECLDPRTYFDNLDYLTILIPVILMTLRETLQDPTYLAEVAACCGGNNKDHFSAHSPWEPPIHYVKRNMGCCGILDEICPVLRAHNHPLIAVGLVAHRWMGARGFTDYPIIDILLRNSQLHSITSDMVRTGHWKAFDAQQLQALPMCSELGQLREADMVLERTHHETLQIYYLRFWSEETYRINIDSCLLIEVPDVYAWRPYLIEEEYHPAISRKDGWWFGPDIRPKPTDCIFPTLPHGKPLGSSEQIFIPSIPTFIQAMWSQQLDYAKSKPELARYASWFIRNLTRYLYLEVSPRRHAIVFQLDEPYDAMMEEYVAKYTRKPRIVSVSPEKAVQVQEWDPTTYPPEYLSRLPVHKMPERPGVVKESITGKYDREV